MKGKYLYRKDKTGETVVQVLKDDGKVLFISYGKYEFPPEGIKAGCGYGRVETNTPEGQEKRRILKEEYVEITKDVFEDIYRRSDEISHALLEIKKYYGCN